MAIDKLKVMLSFMREINDGNIPKSADYGISNEALWDVVEACQDEGLIKGANLSIVFFIDSFYFSFFSTVDRAFLKAFSMTAKSLA